MVPRRDGGTLDSDIVQAESDKVRRRSLTVPDARGQGASLRVTRHPEQRKVVISHWRDDLCVASTPVEIGELPTLIGVLADALGDAVRLDDSEVTSSDTRFLSRIRAWLRPRLAQIVELRTVVRDKADHEQTG